MTSSHGPRIGAWRVRSGPNSVTVTMSSQESTVAPRELTVDGAVDLDGIDTVDGEVAMSLMPLTAIAAAA